MTYKLLFTRKHDKCTTTPFLDGEPITTFPPLYAGFQATLALSPRKFETNNRIIT